MDSIIDLIIDEKKLDELSRAKIDLKTFKLLKKVILELKRRFPMNSKEHVAITRILIITLGDWSEETNRQGITNAARLLDINLEEELH